MSYDKSLDRNGMSLVEVLIAMVIVAVIAIDLMALNVTSYSWLTGAKQETVAANYAYGLLEAVRMQALNEGINWTPDYDMAVPGDLDLGMEVPQGMNATLYSGRKYGYSRLYEVKVTVNWQQNSRNRSVQMSTIIRDRE